MNVAIVTGSAGLVGSAAVELFARNGFELVGIDNDMRRLFFGESASTSENLRRLVSRVPGYRHHDVDVRDDDAVRRIFETYGSDIRCVIHTAAQPSHDWAARDPTTDFDINARATLRLLEQTRTHCPSAPFVFMSTNKVYGDRPNELPLVEGDTRFELAPDHPFYEHGIDESMPVDRSTHSVFGASKLAADVMVQEYGRYFGLPTVSFRAGCVTGSGHAGAQLHGFLSYLVKCGLEDVEYSIFGYRGKQVRDNIHAEDLARMFLSFVKAPRPGAVYNVGGGRRAHSSLLEAVSLVEGLLGRKMRTRYIDHPRVGDHIWYVSDTRKFERDHPDWDCRHDLESILVDLLEGFRDRAA
jgi:CDP-paratose 2-epimerase